MSLLREVDPRGVTVGQASTTSLLLWLLISFSIISTRQQSLANFCVTTSEINYQLVFFKKAPHSSASFGNTKTSLQPKNSFSFQKNDQRPKNLCSFCLLLLWNPLEGKKLIVTHFLLKLARHHGRTENLWTKLFLAPWWQSQKFCHRNSFMKFRTILDMALSYCPFCPCREIHLSNIRNPIPNASL